MAADSGRIIADGRLIFFFLFSFLTSNVYHCPLCFLLFNFSSHSFFFLWCEFIQLVSFVFIF